MPLRTHDIDPKSFLSPNYSPVLFVTPSATTTHFLAATAETALPAAGGYVTLAAKYIPTHPCSVAFVAAGAITTVFRITGLNQFGERVQEDVSVTAADTYYTLNAFKKVTSIQVVSKGGSANQVSIGVTNALPTNATRCRYALPFRPRNANIRTMQDSNNGEVVVVVAVGSVTPVIALVDSQRAAFQHSSALTAGTVYMIISEYQQLGTRGA